ncbi:MAG: sulfite exporter TauE/SafE family protein [Candidatus Omnitrophica bacterium]|nr:sulfite exporter TauE/SafE family protein [Candidatus Omnitrophota bacterium]
MSAWWLVPVFFIIALLYASVGHGGASGYLAALSFVAAGPDEMAATALTLNVVVAGVALVSFARAGHLQERLVWPFVAASVPCAWVGGAMAVSAKIYSWLLAVALVVAAWRLVVEMAVGPSASGKAPSLTVALPVGGAIGWFSGVVGIGGGIFLSPLLLFLNWATPKQAAASSAGFIVLNSAAALIGRATRQGIQYDALWPLLLAAGVGGVVGARLGANHFSGRTLKRLLAVVLLVAAAKLLLAGVAAT